MFLFTIKEIVEIEHSSSDLNIIMIDSKYILNNHSRDMSCTFNLSSFDSIAIENLLFALHNIVKKNNNKAFHSVIELMPFFTRILFATKSIIDSYFMLDRFDDLSYKSTKWITEMVSVWKKTWTDSIPDE